MPRQRHNITRRGLIRATAATGAVAATVSVLSGCGSSSSDDSTNPVVVDESQETSILDKYKEADSPLTLKSTWSIALGNVLHPAEGTWIPCTTAGSSASPMVKGSALSLASGTVGEVISAPITSDSNVEIYDVRCSDSVYAWVELDLLTHSWWLYAQPFSDGALSGKATTLWKADSDYDPPKFCVTGSSVIWLVMPSSSGKKTSESSYCYLWNSGDSKAKAVVESPGRFATEPSVSNGMVTLVPRVGSSSSVYYGITAYKLSDELGTQVDQLVLPQSVKPMNATRIGDKFAFSIESTYSSGGVLGTMGTYIGTPDGPFLALSREPFATVSGKDGLYIIKSTSSYFVVDSSAQTYAVLAATNRCVDYGEYPGTQGQSDSFVTFATVKSQETGYPSAVSVRLFTL
jgi:hypothetical protein